MVRYLVGATGARTGDEASGPALVLLGLAVTGSVGTAGVVLGALTAATALGGPVLGAALDRSGRPHRLLAACLVGYALGLVLIAALLSVPIGWMAVLAALGTGAFGPALSAGWSSRLGGLLPAAALRRGYAADSASFAVSALAGPALAGVLAAALVPQAGVLVAAGLLLAVVPLAATLPARRTPARRPLPVRYPDAAGSDADGRHAGARVAATSEVGTREAGAPDADAPEAGASDAGGRDAGHCDGDTRNGGARHARSSDAAPAGEAASAGEAAGTDGLWRALRRGLVAVASDPPLRAATVVSALSYLGVGVATVCLPVLGATVTGRAGTGAILLSVVAGGALAATAVLARWPVPVGPFGQLVGATGAMGVGLAVLAAAPSLPVAVLGAVVVGVGDGPQLAALLQLRHAAAPAGLRSQVFAAGVSVKQAGYAIGALLAGPLAAWSVRAGLAAAVVAQLAALVFAGPLRNRSSSMS